MKARLADVELPEFGLPADRPQLPAPLYQARLARPRERADARGYG